MSGWFKIVHFGRNKPKSMYRVLGWNIRIGRFHDMHLVCQWSLFGSKRIIVCTMPTGILVRYSEKYDNEVCGWNVQPCKRFKYMYTMSNWNIFKREWVSVMHAMPIWLYRINFGLVNVYAM
jgi:hypothetical protein